MAYDRRAREDQWIATILHPAASRLSTINSAPCELIARPRYSPTAVLVDVAHATSPFIITRMGERSRLTARANAMSPGRW